MANIINFNDIPETDSIIIDVRSPIEFKKGHLVGAYNVPLFTDDERKEIGILYKQVGHDNAVKRGLDFVGPKMSSFIDEVKNIAGEKRVYVYCWRGGMRSESFSWLLNTTGIKSYKIAGGYKGIRKFIREQFVKNAKLIVIGGLTGSGKTDYVKNLENEGYQILDLEGLANHKGSAFGHINECNQPTNEQYENNIYAEWKKFDFSKVIIVEDESLKVGDVYIPQLLFEQMKKAPLIVIKVLNDVRIKRLIRDYSNTDKKLLLEACKSIQKRLGGKEYQEITDAITADNLELACTKLLDYYDKMYSYGLHNKKNEPIHYVDLVSDNEQNNMKSLINACTRCHHPYS